VRVATRRFRRRLHLVAICGRWPSTRSRSTARSSRDWRRMSTNQVFVRTLSEACQTASSLSTVSPNASKRRPRPSHLAARGVISCRVISSGRRREAAVVDRSAGRPAVASRAQRRASPGYIPASSSTIRQAAMHMFQLLMDAPEFRRLAFGRSPPKCAAVARLPGHSALELNCENIFIGVGNTHVLLLIPRIWLAETGTGRRARHIRASVPGCEQ